LTEWPIPSEVVTQFEELTLLCVHPRSKVLLVIFQNAHSAKTVLHDKFVASLAVKHYMIFGNYFAQGQCWRSYVDETIQIHDQASTQ